ncbi:Activating signal cointegrator 1 complex subunit 2 [Beauveria bassiana]|uniref:Activating signal cointegrator 1 complex subunit 2 n=1 Tax=Beauveria bassiana TaxID=176275 RepID=A0A2N6NF30_BEABA|nr:Activating signal cointegrator 1 complex subunit 2 [Beauveria bassiana]
MPNLPSLAAYPPAEWRHRLSSAEWQSIQSAWVTLLQAYINSPHSVLANALSEEDSSLTRFLTTFAQEAASQDASHSPAPALLKAVIQVMDKWTSLELTTAFDTFDHLANLAKIYPKKLAAPVLSKAFTSSHAAAIESSLTALKKSLIVILDAGIRGDLKLAEARLAKLNPLLHASPEACMLFLAGDDFLDSLIVCYKVMNPPLRKIIIATLYLCLFGLVVAQPAKWSMLSDELFALKSAADQHKQGPISANDSLVPELVTSTPLLKVLLAKAEADGAATPNLKKRIMALEAFKKGAMVRPKRLVRRKVDKGKGRQTIDDADAEIHVHRMSQITQVQDLFPDLGAGFVAKCLDEYNEDVEKVVANLLSESLPSHLATADRSEGLSSSHQQPQPDMAPHSTPPQLPTRRNIYDDDELDRLTVDTAKLKLREDTGMADEAVEGWALMLTRNAGQMRRLEAKYAFSGQQRELGRTAWRDSGAEDSDAGEATASRGGRGRGGGGRGRGGRGGGRGRGGGDVARPTGDKATENARKGKEANKGSRANHNRKAGHAKKMARGGFPG